MARVGWQFNNYSWPVNPENDSGWVFELVINEKVPINSFKSRIQIGGGKSDVRKISGWLFGPDSPQQYSNMQSWFKNRVQANLVDHLGNSRRAMLRELSAEAVMSAHEWTQGRQTWKYNAVFMALD